MPPSKRPFWQDAALYLLLVGAVLLLFLSLSGPRAPRTPADPVHRPIAGDSGCLSCHAPGAEAPLPADHPAQDRCLACHKRSIRER